MIRRTATRNSILSALPRMMILLVALFAPLIAMQTVQAGSETVIVDSSKRNSGAGIVIVAGLRRA